MSVCIKCEICGNVHEYGLNGLAIINADGASVNLNTWRNRRSVDLKEKMDDGNAIVMDICDGCKAEVLYEIRKKASFRQAKPEAVE